MNPGDSESVKMIKELLYLRAEIDEGMMRLLEYCKQRAPEGPWQFFLELPITAGVFELYGWIADYLLSPLTSQPSQVLWIGILNPLIDEEELYILSSPYYDPYSDHCDWAFHTDGSPGGIATYGRSTVIRSIYELLQGRLEYPEGMATLALGFLSLAVRDIFAELNPSAVLKGMISKAVVVGLDPASYLRYSFCRIGYVYPHGLYVLPN